MKVGGHRSGSRGIDLARAGAQGGVEGMGDGAGPPVADGPTGCRPHAEAGHTEG